MNNIARVLYRVSINLKTNETKCNRVKSVLRHRRLKKAMSSGGSGKTEVMAHRWRLVEYCSKHVQLAQETHGRRASSIRHRPNQTTRVGESTDRCDDLSLSSNYSHSRWKPYSITSTVRWDDTLDIWIVCSETFSTRLDCRDIFDVHEPGLSCRVGGIWMTTRHDDSPFLREVEVVEFVLVCARAGYADITINETITEETSMDEYDEAYAEPDFSFMYEFGTNEQVSVSAYIQCIRYYAGTPRRLDDRVQ